MWLTRLSVLKIFSYVSNNSHVFVLYMDASKAFDCVCHSKLFDILQAQGMCPLILRALFNLYTHSEPIFKDVRCLKITDMFSVAIWKFYFKLINNKLPHCFSSYKPVLPVVNERYKIRNPGFHLPVINHKFAEQSLKYCLIRQLNKDQSSNIIATRRCGFHFIALKYI